MKTIGTLLLLLGIAVAIGGLAGTVLNLGFSGDPSGLCAKADRRLQEANTAVKAWESAKGSPDEKRLKAEADSALELQKISEKGCAEVRDRSKGYGYMSAGAAAFGFIIAIAGFILRKKGVQQ